MKKIAIIGLGYVGLPLAIAFSKKNHVVGFDINQDRINQLIRYEDSTLEVDSEVLKCTTNLLFTNDPDVLADCSIFIVTVPTPVDSSNNPDFRPLVSASKLIGSRMKKGALVIYESTVYPGATEEICVPQLELASGFKFNVDFTCGYSPERINPGDKINTLTKIKKITSGSTLDAAIVVDNLYREIIDAGTYKASSMKVAEAAKVIENTQRDLNIALINELSIIFHRVGIDTQEVIEAASTKWNFLPFKPGLVGGHCISVDPYYLTYKAQQLNYYPEVILAGRRVNNNIVRHISDNLIRIMIRKEIDLQNCSVLVLGLTFKENCPDLRNSKVFDLVNSLKEYNLCVDIYDPWVNKIEARNEFNIDCLDDIPLINKYSAIVIAVGHDQFKQLNNFDFEKICKNRFAVYDVKGILPKSLVDARL